VVEVVKYSDKLLNAIPVCPEYAKLEVIVEKIAEATGEPVDRVREGVKKALRRFVERGVVVKHPQLGGYYCRKDVRHNLMELEETLEKVDSGVDCIYDVKPPVVKVVFLHVKDGKVEPKPLTVLMTDMTPQLWEKLREKCHYVDPNT
jgi:hypothetical protein